MWKYSKMLLNWTVVQGTYVWLEFRCVHQGFMGVREKKPQARETVHTLNKLMKNEGEADCFVEKTHIHFSQQHLEIVADKDGALTGMT